MRVLRSSDYRRMPWKNGGGETREIIVSPAGATPDTLDWRVSLATVVEDGPFSVFKGLQRTLCVIQGAGIQLQSADRDPVDLYLSSQPHTFDGEVATNARLIDGPIVDLNVMSRRGRFRHAVRRLACKDTLLFDTDAQSLIIYCQRGDLQCGSGTESGSLQADDVALFSDPVHPIQVVTTRATEIIVIEFFPA